MAPLASSIALSSKESSSQVGLTEKSATGPNVTSKARKKEESENAEKERRKKSRGCGIFGYFVANKDDVEKATSQRPMRFFAPVYGGLTIAMALCKWKIPAVS